MSQVMKLGLGKLEVALYTIMEDSVKVILSFIQGFVPRTSSLHTSDITLLQEGFSFRFAPFGLGSCYLCLPLLTS